LKALYLLGLFLASLVVPGRVNAEEAPAVTQQKTPGWEFHAGAR